MIIKVTKTEKINNSQIVCRGKLLCGNIGSFGKIMDIEEVRGKLRPIIISEIENIEVGDKYLTFNNEILVCESLAKSPPESMFSPKRDCFKIISLPGNFSSAQLQNITDGKLKNNDEVIVECETYIEKPYMRRGMELARGDCYHIIKFDNNHISLIDKGEEEKLGYIKKDTMTSFGHKITELDWEEDFSQENGNYENTCCICKSSFFGNKHRVVCKKCATKPKYKLTDEQIEELADAYLIKVGYVEGKDIIKHDFIEGAKAIRDLYEK